MPKKKKTNLKNYKRKEFKKKEKELKLQGTIWKERN
jgi:hypothetical protein